MRTDAHYALQGNYLYTNPLTASLALPFSAAYFVFLKGKELHFQLDVNALKDSLPEL